MKVVAGTKGEGGCENGIQAREPEPWGPRGTVSESAGRSAGGTWVGAPSFRVNGRFAAPALTKSGRVFGVRARAAFVASVAG